MSMGRKTLCLVGVWCGVFLLTGRVTAQLPDTNVTFRVGPTAGGQPFLPRVPSNVILAYAGEPGTPFIVDVGVFASKNAPVAQGDALLIQGFDIALSVAKGTATANLVNWSAGTPSDEGDPKCPDDAALPCLIRDVGFANVDLYDNPSPGHPVWTTGTANGPFEAAVEAAFRGDYSLPPTPETQANAEVEIATFHYGIPDSVRVGQTYVVNLPKSAAGVEATSGNVTRTIVNSVKVGGNDFSPDTLEAGTIRIVARPSVTLNSAALANVDGTEVCLRWQLDPVPTSDPLDPETAPYDSCYGIHIFQDGEDVAEFPLTVTETTLNGFDFCDLTETNTYQVAIRMKEDPSCQCNPDCSSDCAHCDGQIIFSNQLAASRIPHLISGITPDNWPYFQPLTELTVSSDYAFHQNCGLPIPGFDGPYTTNQTICSGASPVIKSNCDDPEELCCSYGTSNLVGSSLWKIEISCSDTDPFTAGDQPYRFVYDGRGGRADTQIVDPFAVRIWYPGTGEGTAGSFANLPPVAAQSAADPLNPRRIPSVYRVALVVVDPERNPADANYVVARSRSLPINFGFRRGDSNRNTAVTLSDVVNILNFWGAGARAVAQLDCAADVNDSGTFTLADAVYLINHVAFSPSGPAPPPPYERNGAAYYGMDASERPPVDLTIANNVLFRCYHYCPCFDAEIRASGGEEGRRTEIGCCVCRNAHFDPGDVDNASCDEFQYDP